MVTCAAICPCKRIGTLSCSMVLIQVCSGDARHLNGYLDRPPVRTNVSLGDSLTGLHAAFGAVMALLHRQRHHGKVPGQVGHMADSRKKHA